MKKYVYIKKNSRELIDKLEDIGFKPDMKYDNVMYTCIILTPENKYQLCDLIPDDGEYYIFSDENMFIQFARHYRYLNLPMEDQSLWCYHCCCESRCKLCMNLEDVYSELINEKGEK